MQFTPFLEGNTRLHWLASSPKNIRVLEYVLKRMPATKRVAVVNSRNALGQTPLHAACKNDNFLAVELLTKAGSLNISDNFGKKPFDFFADSLSQQKGLSQPTQPTSSQLSAR